MESFSGVIVAHDEHDSNKYFLRPHSTYVQTVVCNLSNDGHQTIQSICDLSLKNVPHGSMTDRRPSIGTNVTFTFDQDDLLTTVSVSVVSNNQMTTAPVTVEPIPKGSLSPILSTELTCPICLDIMVRPTTLVCGHSACLTCMTQTLMITNQCPQCRTVHYAPLSVDIALRDAMYQLFPEEKERFESPHALLPPEEEQAESLRDAVRSNNKAWLLNMLLCGYNPNSRLPVDGNNALAHSAQFDERKMAEILLDHGADVNLQDADGDTALMNSAYFRHPRMTKFLLKRGADPTMLSESGLTALDYAKRPGHYDASINEDVVSLLEAAEADWVSDSRVSLLAPIATGAGAGKNDCNISYTEAPLVGGPRRMRVAVAAPMARRGIAPGSTPVGRLTIGDEVLATACAVRGRVRLLRFVDGPAQCPEGWLPEYLPTSNTRILTDTEEHNTVPSSNTQVVADSTLAR